MSDLEFPNKFENPLEILVNHDFNEGYQRGLAEGYREGLKATWRGRAVLRGVEKEREACARIADSYANAPASYRDGTPHAIHSPTSGADVAKVVAELIRRRAQFFSGPRG